MVEKLEQVISELMPKIHKEGYRLVRKRVRKPKFYGGIGTIDWVGCPYKCVYCWVDDNLKTVKKECLGSTVSAELKWMSIGDFKKYLEPKKLGGIRVSGSEPTLTPEYLMEFIDLCRSLGMKKVWIETNGYDNSFFENAGDYRDLLRIYMSIKGVDEKHFEEVTGIEGKEFNRTRKSLEAILDNKLHVVPAILSETLYTKQHVEKLYKFLHGINPGLCEVLELGRITWMPAKRIKTRQLERGFVFRNYTNVEKDWLGLLEKKGQSPIGSDTCNRVTNDMQEKTMKTLY